MPSSDQIESLIPDPSPPPPPPAEQYLSAEENPWRSITYILMTLQIMITLLDLFLESGLIPAMHYTMTALQFVPALFLTIYQIVRIRGLFKYRHATLEDGAQMNELSRKPYIFLFLAFALQLYVLIVSAMWFDISFDKDTTYLEWSIFAVVLIGNLVNPLTYSSVAELAEVHSAETKKKSHMGPGAAIVSVFSKHFMREKLLFVTGALGK